mmetsp:Transcript_29847/g.79700  ORF Transcript_29847/g.79700 Transcript_29847/m.79700 type:complete len:204 (-) Transcript_29847:171-782(-)
MSPPVPLVNRNLVVPVCSSTILHQPPAAPCASSFVAIFGLYSSALTDFFVAMNVTISSRVADGRLPSASISLLPNPRMACLINFAVSRGLEWGPPLFVPPGVLPGVPTPPGVFCPLAVPGDIEVSEETRYGVASAAAEEEDEDEGGGGGGWSDDACFSSVLLAASAHDGCAGAKSSPLSDPSSSPPSAPPFAACGAAASCAAP